MKKFLAVFLALAMVFAMSSVALAVDVTTVPEDEEQAVTVTVGGSVSEAKVYKVTINWGSLAFTYKFDSDAKWDADNHVYADEDGSGTGWLQEDSTYADTVSKTIYVTNHSNDEITATPSYDDDGATPIAGVDFQLSPAVTCANAAEVAYDEPTDTGRENTKTITLTASGQPSDDTAITDQTVGKVVITIAAVTP